MLYSYYMGLDLGQSQDYSTIALLEEALWIPENYRFALRQQTTGWASPAHMLAWQAEETLRCNYHHGRPPDPPLSVRHLERFELGTSYPRVMERVSGLLASDPLRGKRAALVVDKTGVGAAVIDHFVEAGLRPIAVNIHGGDKVTREPGGTGYRVPKRDLVGAALVLLQNKRLKISAGLKLADTLRNELLNFRVKIDPKTAHDSYSHWREADHDDLVLAVALAAWYRQWLNVHIDRSNAARERMKGALYDLQV